MPSTTSSQVLILGAGISGLALAQAFHKSNPPIPFRIFERDAIFNQRAQGYRVKINNVGIDALVQCLTTELFERLKGSCALTTKGMGAVHHLDAVTGERSQGPSFGPARPGMGQGASQQRGPDGPSKAPAGPGMDGDVEPLNADRTVLRSVLMRGLEDFVEFGKEFESFHSTSDGVNVRFADGSEVLGSLLVGADGAGSRVRKQLAPELELVDTEGRFIYGKTIFMPELVETFDKRCLEGMTLIQDRTTEGTLSLLLEPVRFRANRFRTGLPADYVYWVLVARKDRMRMDDEKILGLSNEEAAELAKELTSGWYSSFHAIFDLQEAAQTSLIRIISAKPDIPAWDSSKNVTLIGDAAHVMSPSAGVGATTALRDAATLSRMLAEDGTQVDKVERYQDMMRTYAREAIIRSTMGGKHLFSMRPFEELKSVAT